MWKSKNLIQPDPRLASTSPLTINIDNPLTTFYQNIITLLPEMECRTIIFASSHSGEGVSKIIREFAKICAFRYFKKVLLLDVVANAEGQLAHFNESIPSGWVEATKMGLPVWKTICQVRSSNLYLSSLTTSENAAAFEPVAQGVSSYLDELVNNFDFILIDTPAGMVHAEALLLTNRIDGVIMVVEAGKTRWQTVKKMRNRLMLKNGNILGVILNKRVFPIPKFIYNRL